MSTASYCFSSLARFFFFFFLYFFASLASCFNYCTGSACLLSVYSTFYLTTFSNYNCFFSSYSCFF